MILSESQIDGINNSTVFLRQKNHDSVQYLKYNFQNFAGTEITFHATVFDSGRIVDVGQAVQMNFDNGFVISHHVLYGDVDKLREWIWATIEKLKEENNYNKS